MDSKFKGKIISAIRRLTFTWPANSTIKSKAKVFPATYKCTGCNECVYEGSSDKNYNKALEALKLPIKRGKVHIDHIHPVIPLEGFKRGVWSWDEYIGRMFVDESGLQCLCQECHDIKTKAESKERVKWRKINKEKSSLK